MKKTITTIAILLGITLCATAQNGGLFQRGFVSEEAYNAGNTRNGELIDFNLPGSHGETGDAQASLGGGIAMLVSLGTAYAVAKRRKEE